MARGNRKTKSCFSKAKEVQKNGKETFQSIVIHNENHYHFHEPKKGIDFKEFIGSIITILKWF